MNADSIAYSNLRAEMARKKLTISLMAEKMGKNRDTLSRKLSKKTPIYLDEAIEIVSEFFPEHDVPFIFSTDDLNEYTG